MEEVVPTRRIFGLSGLFASNLRDLLEGARAIKLLVLIVAGLLIAPGIPGILD